MSLTEPSMNVSESSHTLLHKNSVKDPSAYASEGFSH